MSNKKTAKAFAPAGISSFFEICDTNPDGKPIADLEQVGALGGGFGLAKGVYTELTVEEAKNTEISVTINGKLAPEAQTTKKTLEALLSNLHKTCSVAVNHTIEVPVGTGFGTSAGGALTAGLALTRALGLPLTFNQIGKVAHAAEIQCHTGLGTVSSLAVGGGCIMVVKPGAPGICQIDHIPITPDYMVVAGFFTANTPKTVLSNPEKKLVINRFGKKTLEAILKKPTLPNFLDLCWSFAQKTGLATEKTRNLVQLAKEAGAVGAAQNMIGEAVHALVLRENVKAVEEAFKQVLPTEKVIVSNLDFMGARLVGHEKTW